MNFKSIVSVVILLPLFVLCSCSGSSDPIEEVVEGPDTSITPIEAQFNSDFTGPFVKNFTHGFIKMIPAGSTVFESVIEEDSYLLMISTYKIGCNFTGRSGYSKSASLKFIMPVDISKGSDAIDYSATWLTDETLISAFGITGEDVTIKLNQINEARVKGQFSIDVEVTTDFSIDDIRSSGSFSAVNCGQL